MYLSCGSQKIIAGKRSYIMGIINITPDSFSDGGNFLDPQRALDHSYKLLSDGADILDIGGVSTGPLSSHVSYEEELRRVVPVIKILAKNNITNISVDTFRAKIAERVLDLGANWINDQSSLSDPGMGEQIKRAQGIILMHYVGLKTGVNAGEKIKYENLIKSMNLFFELRIKYLDKLGVEKNKIILDPGIGFGKGLGDTIEILNNIKNIGPAEFLCLVGASRKSFLQKITGINIAKERDIASLGAMSVAVQNGAHIVRTHNIKFTKQMLQVIDACKNNKRGIVSEDLYQAR